MGSPRRNRSLTPFVLPTCDIPQANDAEQPRSAPAPSGPATFLSPILGFDATVAGRARSGLERHDAIVRGEIKYRGIYLLRWGHGFPAASTSRWAVAALPSGPPNSY
jgi:hypothetical protein